MARTASYDRDAALEAAMTLFWRKGYHATSLKDLEAALKLKPGSIYAAFDSKENLYLLSLQRYFERSRQGFRDHMARAASPLAGLARHFRSYADLAPEDASRQACMLTKTLVDTMTTDPKIAEATQIYLDQMREEFATAFTEAREAGELPSNADPDRLARRFQANVTALRVELHRGSLNSAIHELTEDMAQEIESLRSKGQ